MKKTILLMAIVALGVSACTQKTCPTYSKADQVKPAVDVKIQAIKY
ncbi:MAG: hypothetical protein OEW75_03445 [Cyclobacteriaceae bacterium]|nr:hypothetical protein [Cyclobacteriaceae bacterium]